MIGAPCSPQSRCKPSLILTGNRRKTRPAKRLSTSCHDRSTRESDGIHLQALSAELTVLTREHADFIVFEAEGPLKGGHYRYRTAHTKDGIRISSTGASFYNPLSHDWDHVSSDRFEIDMAGFESSEHSSCSSPVSSTSVTSARICSPISCSQLNATHFHADVVSQPISWTTLLSLPS